MQEEDFTDESKSPRADHAYPNDRELVHAAFRMSQPSFAAVWDNPDAEYDNLGSPVGTKSL